MANIRCDLKNIRPREIRGFLEKNKVIFTDTEIGLPIPYIIKAMHQSDVYVNGKLVETFQEAAALLNNITVVETTPEDLTTAITNAKEGDVITLAEGEYTTPITIDKSCNLSAKPGAKIKTSVTITAGNVNIDAAEFEFDSTASIAVTNDADVSFVGCKFSSKKEESVEEVPPVTEPTEPVEGEDEESQIATMSTKAEEQIRTFISVKSKGQVVFENCTFEDNGTVYNFIEFDITGEYPVSDVIVRNCTFTGKIKNNYISFYNMVDNANIVIENCTWDFCANAIRISNPDNANATFTIKDCTYKATNSDEYAGFMLFQDYAKESELQDFTKVTVKFINLTGPNGKVTRDERGNGNKQVYYVYDDQDGLLTDKNQPKVSFA